MTTIAAVIFWLCAAAMVHTYVTYPLSLKLFRRRFAKPPEFRDGAWPTVAMLIPAYNEEAVIADKVRNSLALDYEAGKLEILIGSDGSTDQTNALVKSFQDPRVKLIELGGRNGKTGVLNHLVKATSAEILIFTDANVEVEKTALRKLIRHFADPGVGTSGAGKYIRVPRGADEVKGEAIYADIVNRLKKTESDIGGMSGGLGSLMAMRRELYQPYRPGSTNDDTVPSLLATFAGKRNVYDLEAKAYEESGHGLGDEFRRRIRIGAGNFQTLFRYPAIFLPKYGVAAYTFISHKVIRWIFPVLLILVLIANLLLIKLPIYQLALGGQLAFYLVAFVGGMALKSGIKLPIATGLFHFVSLNAGLLLGLFVYLKGIRSSAWDRTER